MKKVYQTRSRESGVVEIAMKKVYQTRHGIYGDCMPACVASIMEIPLKGMPRIKATSTDWAQHWQKFLKPYGLGLLWYMARGHKRPRGYAVAAHRIRGNGKRYFHAVVYKDGKKVHDPYPAGDKGRELLGIEYWIVFTVLDASKVNKSKWRNTNTESKHGLMVET